MASEDKKLPKKKAATKPHIKNWQRVLTAEGWKRAQGKGRPATTGAKKKPVKKK